MQRSHSHGDKRRTGRLAARLRHGLAPLVFCLIPSLAQAQNNSPGGIAAGGLPSLPAPPAAGTNYGGGAWGIGSALPGIFDAMQLFGDLSEVYETNAAGGAGGGSDFDTRGSLGFTAAKATAHLNAQIIYQLNVDYFARESSELIVTNNLNANVTDELIPDHVILQLQAYAMPVNVSGLGNVAAPGQVLPPGANGDQRSSYGYMFQPDFFFKLGHFLRSDTLPSYSATYYDGQAGAPAPTLGIPLYGQFSSLGVTEKITSGDLFTRLQWGAFANYSQTGQSGSNLTQRSATGELSYAIDHGVSLVADIGYQTISAHTPINSPVNGPTLLGGLRFDMARLTGEFRVGEQYHSFSGVGHLSYQITPRFSLVADAQDGINNPGMNGLLSPGQLIAGLLSGIASGQIQIPPGGALNLQDLPGILGLQNGIARTRSDTLSAFYAGDEYNATGVFYSSSQDTLSQVQSGQNGNQKTTGFNVNIGHEFTPDLNGQLTFGYYENSLLVGHSGGFDFGVRTNYVLNLATQFYASIDYFDRDADNALSAVSARSGDFSNVYLQLGIRHQFL